MMSTTDEMARIIEALLMVADQPVPPGQIADLIGCEVTEVEVAAAGLIQSYADDGRGFVLQRVAGGLRFQSHPDLAAMVARFVLDGQAARLSAAALETMAIIAYKQPISRNQISAIRGVSAEGVVRTLEARGYVEEVAKDPGPGRATLYGTTASFLERLGLNSIDELPPLGQFVPSADVVEALESTLLVGDPLVRDPLVGDPLVGDPSGSPDSGAGAAVDGEQASALEVAAANVAADDWAEHRAGESLPDHSDDE